MDLGTVVTRDPDVRSRISRPREHPMDVGTVVSRRPALRWGGGRTDTDREGALVARRCDL